MRWALSWSEPAAAIEAAVTELCRRGPKTPDMGGSARTDEVTAALVEALH